MTEIRDTGVSLKSDRLSNKNIGLGICGGIGAVESVKIIREMRRYGAEVTAFFTPSTDRFITPLSVEWACGRAVHCKPQAQVDHLEAFDLVVIAPCTFNTLSKIAQGIADNLVTLLVASHIGSGRPWLVVPTMNESLAQHPLWEDSKERLSSWGATFLESAREEGRIKMPSREQVVEEVLRLLN